MNFIILNDGMVVANLNQVTYIEQVDTRLRFFLPNFTSYLYADYASAEAAAWALRILTKAYDPTVL